MAPKYKKKPKNFKQNIKFPNRIPNFLNEPQIMNRSQNLITSTTNFQTEAEILTTWTPNFHTKHKLRMNRKFLKNSKFSKNPKLWTEPRKFKRSTNYKKRTLELKKNTQISKEPQILKQPQM